MWISATGFHSLIWEKEQSIHNMIKNNSHIILSCWVLFLMVSLLMFTFFNVKSCLIHATFLGPGPQDPKPVDRATGPTMTPQLKEEPTQKWATANIHTEKQKKADLRPKPLYFPIFDFFFLPANSGTFAMELALCPTTWLELVSHASQSWWHLTNG